MRDLSLGTDGTVWVTQNAAAGVGGMGRFDGSRWYGWNDFTYGLGAEWPLPTDNADAIAYRPSSGRVAVNPTFSGIREWTGSAFLTLDTGSTSEGLVEDSMGRLWDLAQYPGLRYHDGSAWTQVGPTYWGGYAIQRDPDRPGTIWTANSYEVMRTDGVYSFSRGIGDFPELNPSNDAFTGLAATPGGLVWIGVREPYGAGGALIRLDSNTGTYRMLRYDQGWPLPGLYVRPLAATPDGRVWMQYESPYPSTDAGMCWYDGTNVGTFPAPPGGVPQWGGLPHAGIGSLEVRVIPDGYELWMSCISRGLAVLTVQTPTTSVPAENLSAARLSLVQNEPNPFHTDTRVRFALARPEHVVLDIFDVGGRRVRTLVNETLSAGSHQVNWNGRGDNGGSLSSGVYHYRLSAGSEAVERKMLLLR